MNVRIDEHSNKI